MDDDPVGWELDAVELDIWEPTDADPEGAEFVGLESAPCEPMGTEPVGWVDCETESVIWADMGADVPLGAVFSSSELEVWEVMSGIWLG